MSREGNLWASNSYEVELHQWPTQQDLEDISMAVARTTLLQVLR
jgi:hypothetical protein